MTPAPPAQERLRAIAWLKENDPLPYFLETVRAWHVGDEPLILAHILAAHSIGLADSVDPIHLYTIGRSGKGKGHCANSVLRLFSDDYKIPLASFSPKVLFYASQNDGLQDKIVHAPEVAIHKNDEEKIALLRILTDSPSNNLRAEHWTLNDKREAVRLRLDGRISFWFNSETPLADNQLKNRVLLGNPSESAATDTQVHELQKRTIGLLQNSVDEQRLEFCRLLNQVLLFENHYDVLIPFAQFIDFPHPDNRRLFPLFLTLLKATTKISMWQRIQAEKIGGGRTVSVLIAEPEDFYVAAFVWDSLYPVTRSQVSQAALELLKYLPQSRDAAMGKEQLSEVTGLSQSWCSKKARELYDAGLCSYERIERRYLYWNSDTSRTELGVRLHLPFSWESRLNDAFQGISDSKSGGAALPLYQERVTHSQNFSPSWLEGLKSANTTDKQHLTSESEMNPRSSEMSRDVEIPDLEHDPDA